MKYQTTQKAIKENYTKIVAVGYCQLQYLLMGESAMAYNAGVYGWNCDYYHIDNDTVICTGYRPHGDARLDWEVEHQADTDAKKRYYDEYTHGKITFAELQAINRAKLVELCNTAK